MSNMAKARNIFTEEITSQQYATSITITGIGFKPDHIVLFKRPGGYASGGVVSIFDESLCYIAQQGTSSHIYASGTVSLTFDENNITISVSTGTTFSGTFRYVAWQE